MRGNSKPSQHNELVIHPMPLCYDASMLTTPKRSTEMLTSRAQRFKNSRSKTPKVCVCSSPDTVAPIASVSHLPSSSCELFFFSTALDSFYFSSHFEARIDLINNSSVGVRAPVSAALCHDTWDLEGIDIGWALKDSDIQPTGNVPCL